MNNINLKHSVMAGLKTFLFVSLILVIAAAFFYFYDQELGNDIVAYLSYEKSFAKIFVLIASFTFINQMLSIILNRPIKRYYLVLIMFLIFIIPQIG